MRTVITDPGQLDVNISHLPPDTNNHGWLWKERNCHFTVNLSVNVKCTTLLQNGEIQGYSPACLLANKNNYIGSVLLVLLLLLQYLERLLIFNEILNKHSEKYRVIFNRAK